MKRWLILSLMASNACFGKGSSAPLPGVYENSLSAKPCVYVVKDSLQIINLAQVKEFTIVPDSGIFMMRFYFGYNSYKLITLRPGIDINAVFQEVLNTYKECAR